MPTLGMLQQEIEQNHDSCEDSHTRLRADYRSLEARVIALAAQQVACDLKLTNLDAKITQIETRPTDLMRLRFDTKTVLAVVLAALIMGAGQWGLNTTLKTDVLSAIQTNAEKQDSRYAEQQKFNDDMKKEFRLLQMNVTDFMINGKRQKSRGDER
jgi:septal ring factor EnvC (AmiA/AmiB activator)